MMKVYISGPIDGMIDRNVEGFNQAEKELRAAGYSVFNPTTLNFDDQWSIFDRREVIATIMSRCDAIFQLTGWSRDLTAHFEDCFSRGSGMKYIHKKGDGSFVMIQR